ncbi:cation-translocating P-type ATPase [Alkaliphilus pronyensis]|uniref:P-type Ca(2+) transporter n=1 Tax=Alkaliphilus pronyensis TaxID=1482732 RepID=A0A6I0FAF3_9FIRM|nr:HAD-IC family P-type ATPase [Alkaliphilus pronyensis]KAB3535753.1 cation-translocating P-type ATPase [Alkaliphilus pronyensis]
MEEINFYVLSSIPGRIRFKSSELYQNPNIARCIYKGLAEVKDINRAIINIYSSTILVIFNDKALNAEEVFNVVKDIIRSYQTTLTLEEETKASISVTKDSVVPLKKAIGNEDNIIALKANYKKPYRKNTLDHHSFYKMSINEIKLLLKSDIDMGLQEAEALKVLESIGYNEFEGKKKMSVISMFFQQFNDYIMKLLLAASGASMFLGQVADAITIIAIVVVEAILGVWQNYKAERSLEALEKYTAPVSKVIRDGETKIIPSRNLVPGDIICFEAGDIVPADARLINSSNLQLHEASLTGESEAIEKTYKINYTKDVPLADRKNMVFLGTRVIKGNGKAIVVNTGMNTEMGKIAKLIDETEEVLTPLQKDLNRLAKVITWGCVGISIGVIISGVLGGQPFLEMLRTGVSLAVGAIPEGLSTVLAISLAFGVQRMSKKGAIVKRLPSVETLSCADIICTDKTGTLTTGQMTVTEVYTFNKEYKIGGDANKAYGDFYHKDKAIDVEGDKTLKQLITVAYLCNNAHYKIKDNEEFQMLGDPTEVALKVLAEKAKLKIDHMNCYTRVKELAFDSEIKKMTVICKDHEDKYTVNIKGAPDVILNKCNKLLDEKGIIREITSDDLNAINRYIDNMAEKSLRVMAFGFKELSTIPDTEDEIEEDVVFLGLTGLIDPPRPRVASSIKKCHKAGIKVVMITGDHKKTALAIGKQINLLDKGGTILTGLELDQLSDKELTDIIDDIVIFARTSPNQKLKIVKALKNKGHIVAMTGDGINDAPAIKEANIGIAMGKAGTDVTREAASIILVDDNFTTIVKAIEEGRGISGNVKKFIRYVLTGNIGAVFTILTASLLRMPTPLIASQILMINLVTEGIPALALGLDSPSYNIMEEPPRDAKKSIFDKPLLKKIISRGLLMGLSALGLFTGTYLFTGNITRARTLAYAGIVVNQMLHVFDCREKTITENKYLLPAVGISTLILVGSIYIPAIAHLFGTCPLSIIDWIALLFMATFIGRLDYIKEKATRLVTNRMMPIPA